MAKSIIEGAYLVGFELSSDNLSDEALYAEAVSTEASLWVYLCLEILTGLGQYL